MSLVKDYIEQSGGNWRTAKNTQRDATVTIRSVSLDEDTFNKPYIIIGGIYDPTGEETSVRLGVSNLKQIAEVLGESENAWIGHKLKAMGFRDYPGLGSRGILWTGERVAVVVDDKQGLITSAGPETVIAAILKARPDLSRNEVLRRIKVEEDRSMGEMGMRKAAYLVASELHVKIS